MRWQRRPKRARTRVARAASRVAACRIEGDYMRTKALLFAGMAFSFVAFGGQESFTESLFRSKYGRSTPLAEAREKKAAQKTGAHAERCVAPEKCSATRAERPPVESSPAVARNSWQESLFRAKYGRSLPSSSDPVVVAKTDRTACPHGCCSVGE